MKLDKYEITKVLDDCNLENSKLWRNEAEFGFSHLKEPISSLAANSEIFEVGCGSGILLSMLAEEFSQHNFMGIEPFGEGFSSLKELNAAVRKLGVSLSTESYEEHQSKYDFIYCVNVFEHVDDWRHFLDWASNNLKENGRFLVLCPNYGFPYESHFRIPIIINKRFTFKVFKKYILNYEKNNKCGGLWHSLNFVKKSDVLAYCKNNASEVGLSVSDDISIIDYMIERVSKDAEFKKRQSIIGIVASLLNAVGILNLIKMFPNFLPYMKLSFRKTEGLH
jgi:2-polyprenyl-3-methyl-5-hydroxy-6-metoxy-1,4-benzoquinol methylase